MIIMPKKKTPPSIDSNPLDDLQRSLLNQIITNAKETSVISKEEFNEQIVQFISYCEFCGKKNTHTILTEVLFHSKTLTCYYCKAMYPIHPVPAIIETDKEDIDKYLKE